MKSKLYSYSQVVTVFIAMLTILLIASFNSTFVFSADSKGQVYYVSADGGLRMRTEPNTNSSLVILIPNGSKVFSHERSNKTDTISGNTSLWHKVKYTDTNNNVYTGWVFGGFLSNESLSGESYENNKNFLRKCKTLDKITTPFFITNKSPENVKNDDYVKNFMLVPMMGDSFFELQNNNQGTYSEISSVGLGMRIVWQNNGNSIEIKGSYKYTQTEFLDKNCRANAGFMGKEQLNDCLNKHKDEWEKKYGNKTDIVMHPEWTVTFSKKGEVLVVSKNIDDIFTFGATGKWACGY